MRQFTRHQRRGMLVSAMLLGIVGVAAAAAVQFAYRLPNPETADLDGLCRWMVLCDLQREDTATRQLLVKQFASKLDAGVDLDQVDAQMTPDQVTTFWHNVDVLVEEWFRLQATEYSSLVAATRENWLEEHLTRIDDWGVMPYYRRHLTPPGKPPIGDLEMLGTARIQFDIWIERAPAEKRQQLQQFSGALQSQLIKRSVGQFQMAWPF